jgi:hypothetical protein
MNLTVLEQGNGTHSMVFTVLRTQANIKVAHRLAADVTECHRMSPALQS